MATKNEKVKCATGCAPSLEGETARAAAWCAPGDGAIGAAVATLFLCGSGSMETPFLCGSGSMATPFLCGSGPMAAQE